MAEGMTIPELAERLGLKPATVQLLAKRDDFPEPVSGEGTRWNPRRYDVAEVEAWNAARRKKAPTQGAGVSPAEASLRRELDKLTAKRDRAITKAATANRDIGRVSQALMALAGNTPAPTPSPERQAAVEAVAREVTGTQVVDADPSAFLDRVRIAAVLDAGHRLGLVAWEAA